MCGIIGILGDHEVAPALVESLKRLEYRGYDSAGIATVNDGRLDRRRAVGKLVNLSDVLVHDPLPGKAGIGHTRWATHGAPTEGNAHPHRSGAVAVVHNGIIENFRDLREELAAHGITPATETDTEVVALMADHLMSTGLSAVDAARATVAKLEGAFAIAFLFDGEPDLMIAARFGPPLAIGHAGGEAYIGSDAIALGALTDEVTYLEDGDIAVLTRSSVEIRNADGQLANRDAHKIAGDTAVVDKGGHRHFMAKEIAEQPAVLNRSLDAYLTDTGITLPEGLDLSRYSRVVMVACGTAFIACQVAKYWLERIARIPVEVDIASEFRYREPPIPEGTLAIFVSQSGETADTLAALRYVQEKAETIVAVVNVPESSIARESDVVLPILAGTEVGVASTKAFTAQLAALAALSLEAGRVRGHQTLEGTADEVQKLKALPGILNQALSIGPRVDEVSRKLAEARDILFLGRGAMYPLAMEGALKLKEISYIHAEGYASGELKHGPIALVDKHVPVIVMAPRDRLFDKTVSNMQEVMARGGRVVLVSDAQGITEAGDGIWQSIAMPEVDETWAPIIYAVAAQLLAYHTAVAKGTDVDQPRNLAKSVTVE